MNQAEKTLPRKTAFDSSLTEHKKLTLKSFFSQENQIYG